MKSNWTAPELIELVPEPGEETGVQFAEEHVKLVGSALGEDFKISKTPWNQYPLNCATDGEHRSITHVKPVQSGGSAIGEACFCKWIAREPGGDGLWNWPDNTKAQHRFETRIERILKACDAVMDRAPDLRAQAGRWKNCKVIFPHMNLTVQGVHEAKNLDSDTVRFMINEEVHDWSPGFLQKAYNRTTAVWNYVIVNISNASIKNDQLHQIFLSGTQEHWMVKCPDPKCGKHHILRTRWEDKHPELGGLRYDSSCRLPDGRYDYKALSKTVRFQMPCGASIPDDPTIRRRMSQAGKYSEPQNPGAMETDVSTTLQAVSVDYIPWLQLIKEKHDALESLRHGNPEPWWRYLAERECQFVDKSVDRPVVNRISTNLAIKKNREGLKDRICRFAALDRQQGSLAKGELPYWWYVIRDCDVDGNSLLVDEGRKETDEEMAFVLKDHEVDPLSVVADTGDDTVHVYRFCLLHGYNGIKGGKEKFYMHKDGGRRIFSPERPLYQLLNQQPTKEDPAEEPLFWMYSKHGIHERLYWLRGAEAKKWEVPGDVSDDYRKHLDSVEYVERRSGTGETVGEFIFHSVRYDLEVCEAYIAMLMEMAGLIGPDVD